MNIILIALTATSASFAADTESFSVLPALIALTATVASSAADTESFSVPYGDCYGRFSFVDQKSQEFCKPNISERQCADLVEFYERRFRERFAGFYHASMTLDATSGRTGCAFSKSFPK